MTNKIKLAVFDLDGVLSNGKRFAKDVLHPEKILDGERENLDCFNEFMSKQSIPRVAVTGRSLIITKPIVEYCMNGISACEHGCMIYNPKKNEEYHLADNEEKFNGMIRAKNALENFVEESSRYDKLILKQFPELTILRLTDNLHIITYELFDKDGSKLQKGETYSREIYNFIYNNFFSDEIKKYLASGKLTPLFSQVALDIKPNISKADGLQHIVSKLAIPSANTLIGGDSFHSDLAMMKVVKEGYWFCPGNSDNRLKEEVSNRGIKGYVAKGDYFEGTMEALYHFFE